MHRNAEGVSGMMACFHFDTPSCFRMQQPKVVVFDIVQGMIKLKK